MDREKVIKEYEDYVNSYISLTTSHDYEFEMHKAVLALLKEQQEQIEQMNFIYGFVYGGQVKEIKKLVRCNECKHRDPEDHKCDCGHDIQWQLPRADDWFCADGQQK